MLCNSSQSKKRIRDEWTNLKDHPHLQATNSDDENSPKFKLGPEPPMSFTKGDNVAKTKSINEMRPDLRQDAESSRELGQPQSDRQLNAAKYDGDLKAHPEDEMKVNDEDEIGFEIEMEMDNSSLPKNLSSTSSSLVFSISRVSNSSNDMVEKDHLWESSQKRKDIPASLEADAVGSIFSRNAQRRPGLDSLNIGDEEPSSPSNIRSETPKAHNRSSTQQPQKSRQILSAASNSAIQKKCLFTTRGLVSDTEREIDSYSTSSPKTHPSLEDTPSLEDSQRGGHSCIPSSHPSMEDAPMNQVSMPHRQDAPMDQAFMPHRQPTSPISVSHTHPSLEDTSVNLSSRTHPSLEDNACSCNHSDDSPTSVSSEEVDDRWEKLREKLLSVNSSSPTKQSEEGNGAWEQQRERLFTTKSPTLTSLSDDMEYCLIQDCIETGLPPPRVDQGTKIPSLSVPSLIPQRELAAEYLLPVYPGKKNATCTNENGNPEWIRTVSKNATAITATSPRIKRAESSEYPSKIPSSDRKTTEKRNISEMETSLENTVSCTATERTSPSKAGFEPDESSSTLNVVTGIEANFKMTSRIFKDKVEADSRPAHASSTPRISSTTKKVTPHSNVGVGEEKPDHTTDVVASSTTIINKLALNRGEERENTHSKSLEVQNLCMQETMIDTVNSGLTGEFDEGDETSKGGSGYSIISDIEVDDITNAGDIKPTFSSCSESEEPEGPPGLDLVISDASEESNISSSGSDQDSFAFKSEMKLPTPDKKVLNEKGTKLESDGLRTLHNQKINKREDNGENTSGRIRGNMEGQSSKSGGPRIEVTLVASSSEASSDKGDARQHQKSSDKVNSPFNAPCTPSLFSELTDLNTSSTNTIESEEDTSAERQRCEPTGCKERQEQQTSRCDLAREQHTSSDVCEEYKKKNAMEKKCGATQRNFHEERKTGAGANIKIIISNEPSKTADQKRITGAKVDDVELYQTKAKVPSDDKHLQSNVQAASPDAHRLLITGRKEFMDPKDTRLQDLNETFEGDTTLIDVASTVTFDTISKNQSTAAPSLATSAPASQSAITSTPVLRKSTKKAACGGDNIGDAETNSNHDLSVGFKDTKSFDTKISSSTDGIPTWRLDPSQSLSNFSIQIVNEENDQFSTYNIHKHMVAVGSRRSEYFDSVFRSTNAQSTKVVLEERASNLFPQVLDYMYCHDVEIHITTETSLAYRRIALKFRIIPLVVNAAGFILQDLQTETMATYIEQANYYKDERILELIVARCAEKIETFDVTDPMWAVMEPDTFLQILSHPSIDREKLSTHISILVTEYQTMHKYEVDSSKFRMLTTEELLPIIDRSAALPLLEICDEYGCPEEFQALQKRCAHVMACYWKITSEGDRRRVFALLRGLPSNFTVDFLETIEIGKSATLVNAHMSPRRNGKPQPSSASNTTFTLGRLCDDLAGEDGYSIGSSDNYLLSWRVDPQKTYSDWKIKVKHHGTQKIDMYNVHKHILSIGSYKSNFFADVFLSETHTRTRRGITTIELAHAAAVLVPAMLDFIYSPEHTINASQSTAVALRFLARVFGVWMLNKKLLEFVAKNMTLDNILEYIKEAETFDDEKITAMAVRLCVQNIQSIKVDSHLLKAIKPDFFGKVVSSSEIEKGAQCHVSILTAKYFTLHDLSEALLGQLLQVSQMTEIDPISALELLKIIGALQSKETEIFKKLRQRCAQVITDNWSELRENNRKEMFEVFHSLESNIVVDIFEKVEAFYNEQQAQTMTLQVKLVKRYRKQLADARALREDEIVQLQKEKDDKIEELSLTRNELEEQLRQQSEVRTRRNVRSSGAYRSPSPKSRARALATRNRKSFIPKYSQPPKTVLAELETPNIKPLATSKPASTTKPTATSQPTKAGKSAGATSRVRPEISNPSETTKLTMTGSKPAKSPKVIAVSKVDSTTKATENKDEALESVPKSLAEARKSAMKSIATPNTKQTSSSPAGSLFGFSFFSCATTGTVTHSDSAPSNIPSSFESRLAGAWNPTL